MHTYVHAYDVHAYVFVTCGFVSPTSALLPLPHRSHRGNSNGAALNCPYCPLLGDGDPGCGGNRLCCGLLNLQSGFPKDRVCM